MSQPLDSSPQPPLNEQLPPISPPGPGFLMQLFVIPAVIVGAIILVWGMFVWLAQKGNDVDSYLDALERNTPARWQAAVSLADLIRHSPTSAVRENAEVLRRLPLILEKELSRGPTEQEADLRLRAYLCNALGELRGGDPLPLLERAFRDNPSPAAVGVRFAALKGIAVFLEARPEARPAAVDHLLPLLASSASDPESLIRSTTTFVLGVLDDPRTIPPLTHLLNDAQSEVRFNAATMLARRGEGRARDVLQEMLAYPEPQSSENATVLVNLIRERESILINALRAVGALHQAAPQVDLAPLLPAIDALATANIPRGIQLEAIDIAKTLRAKANP